MEIFYSSDITATTATLGREESNHCVRVLRHRPGDRILVIDGEGTMYECDLLSADADCACASVVSVHPHWGCHPYRLTMAVCPTKNPDRYEWFAEKATEIGVDTIVPVIGDRSERKVFKPERVRRILLSAAKQSLKGAVPACADPVGVKEFISGAPEDALKLIAYCFEDDSQPRVSIRQALCDVPEGGDIIVLIGPEGDFSPQEVALALECGFKPVHLGNSRLRTETAALTAVQAAYLRFM